MRAINGKLAGHNPQKSNHFIMAVRDKLLRGGRIAKAAGQVVSYAPSFSGTLVSVSVSASGRITGLALATSSFVALGSAAFGQSLPAQCTATPEPLAAGSTVNCVAEAPEVIDGIRIEEDDITLNVGDAETPTAVNNMSSAGVLLSGAGSQTVNIVNAGSSVTGSSVTGSGAGVDVTVSSGEGDLTITSEGDITGETDGIDAVNRGSGALRITVGGDVTGITNEGLVALNDSSSSTDLSVTSSGVISGEDFGLFATNYGTGALSIEVHDVVAFTRDAINTYNTTNSTDLSITTTGSLYGGEDGIDALNYGSGQLTISVTGDVVGINGAGIIADGGLDGSGVSVSTLGLVQGGGSGVNDRDGILAIHGSNGSISISATGSVTSTNGTGISADNAMFGDGIEITTQGTVLGQLDGISATNEGSGAININMQGMVTGSTGAGISARNSSNGIGLAITTDGSVFGGTSGIDAINNGSGDLNVNSSGLVEGLDFGISAVQNGEGALNINASTSNVVAFAGDGIAINAENTSASRGDITISAGGAYGDTGIRARQQGTGALSINVEDARSLYGNGIDAENSEISTGDLTITSTSNVQGGLNDDGIAAIQRGSGDLIINTVDVSGGDGIEAGAFSTSTGNVSITSTGIVRGEAVGIRSFNNGSGGVFVDVVDVVGTNQEGIQAETSSTSIGDITVTSTGTVSGRDQGIRARQLGTGALSLTVRDVVAQDDEGIDAESSAISAGDLTITSTGMVRGGDEAGIRARQAGTGDLNVDAVDVFGRNAIDVETDTTATGDVSISSSGVVEGANIGIWALNEGTGALSVDVQDVTGTSYSGIVAANLSGASGDLTVTGRGTITGRETGVVAASYSANAATTVSLHDVTSETGTAIVAGSFSEGDLTVTTTGRIEGQTTGIYARHLGSGALRITVSDEVSGATIAGINTITLEDQLSEITLESGARVSSETGDAIVNNEGNSRTEVLAGASVVGSVSLGAGADAFIFDGADFSDLTIFDAGDDVDTLTFVNTSGGLDGSDILNVENFVIGNGAQLFIDDQNLTADNVIVESGGILDAIGGLTVNGSLLASSGLVRAQNDSVGDIVRVTEDFVGGGTFSIDTDFAAGTGDTLIVEGDVRGGTTRLDIIDISASETLTSDILVVDVAGAVSEGDFVLADAPGLLGLFTLGLDQRDGQFFLSNLGVNSTGAVYEATPSVLLDAFSNTGTLRQRQLGRQWLGGDASAQGAEVGRLRTFLPGGVQGEREPRQGAWVQFRGGFQEAQPESSTSGLDYDSTTFGARAGLDFLAPTGARGQWVLGATAQFGTLNADVSNANGSGEVDATGYGIGATATWYGNSGTYFDIQGQINRVEADIRSSLAGSLISNETFTAYALSGEVGHRIQVSDRGSLIPQAQLTVARLAGDSFTDDAGNLVDPGTNTATFGRLGLAYEYASANTTAYTLFNLLHDFSGTRSIQVADTTLSSRNDRTFAEIGFGGTVTVGDNLSLFAEGTYASSLSGDASNNRGASLTAGATLTW
ncbi:autotransporter outer membrane beta-barrel domain-containing protein [Ruegeria atlantica]|uniref:autotransporter outer membrane beta-barrel domain-containing protein n=1 Tax=Ruegeria atlantica TaxID=81569 RepID=UPI00147A4521|nr:autotransporter outer membrane beta-barrel domain-containing protein [Ruegeria atlantica]